MDALPGTTIWYLESITPELIMAEGLRKVLYTGRTRYQHVQVLETGPYGRTLVLDGKTQSSEADEWVYHEALVQPAMAAHSDPRRVFIAGGGEGATAREVLRSRDVTEVVMVDLDREVVEVCREHLPNHHQGAFDDPRLTLLHEDALAYLEREAQGFDVIIIDVPDPLESGPAYLLFTQEFYRLVQSRLNPGGLMAAQAGPAGPINVTETFTAVHRTVGSVFDRAHPYRAYMPSFGTIWGFVIGTMPNVPDLLTLDADQIDERIQARLASPLRYYDGLAHGGLFALPKYIRRAFAEETRLITKDQPLYAV